MQIIRTPEEFAKSKRESMTRRRWFSRVGIKAAALAGALLGFSPKAIAAPLCCILANPNGGYCEEDGYPCLQLYGLFLCWPCDYMGTTIQCCECFAPHDPEPINCLDPRYPWEIYFSCFSS